MQDLEQKKPLKKYGILSFAKASLCSPTGRGLKVNRLQSSAQKSKGYRLEETLNFAVVLQKNILKKQQMQIARAGKKHPLSMSIVKEQRQKPETFTPRKCTIHLNYAMARKQCMACLHGLKGGGNKFQIELKKMFFYV